MKKEVILILDFGSQYTHLIAQRIREEHVFSRIVPYNISAKEIKAIKPKGIILSGGSLAVYNSKRGPMPEKSIFKLNIPILGICYGAKVIIKAVLAVLLIHIERKAVANINPKTTIFGSTRNLLTILFAKTSSKSCFSTVLAKRKPPKRRTTIGSKKYDNA